MAAVHAPPETWHTRLTTRLADVQRAVAGLRAVCEEPAARQTLEASQRGYAAASVAPLLAEAELRTANAIGDMQSVRSALTWHAPAAGFTESAFSFVTLPPGVALHIFAMLPPDVRARAALVCRDWRAAVAERSLWTRLVLSPESGVTSATLHGAAARATGQLVTLVLENCSAVSRRARLQVVRANASSLRELRCLGDKYKYFEDDFLSPAHVEKLARAAPQLQLFAADLRASAADATRLLHNDAPFQALRVRYLVVHEAAVVDTEAVVALAAAMSTHASLEIVCLSGIALNAPAALDAACTAALSCRPNMLRLERCGLSPASSVSPALARLIRDGSLRYFFIDNGGALLLDATAAVQLADAIATNRQLQSLALCASDLWCDADAAAAVLHALIGHPTLCTIDVGCNHPYDKAAAGAALGALVAANAPALETLRVDCSFLSDTGLGPLVDALPHNTHLRDLICYKTGMSEAFARDRFLPAVQANTSLRELEASSWWNDEEEGQAPPAVLQAEALVAARNAR